jgi:alpha-tubulin suppressor-like RCC1 family protein
MFGSGAYGVLGIGNEKSVSCKNPAEVTYFTKNKIRIKDVAMGEQHSVFLSDEGKVYTCGYGGSKGLFSFFQANKAGALGHGNKTHLGFPKQVAFFERQKLKVNQIAAGRYHTVVLTEGGHVYTWGRGSYGTLGTGSTAKELSPVLVNTLEKMREADSDSNIVKIDAADHFTAILTKSGLLFTWGENNHGQLGMGQNVGIDIVESITIPASVSFNEKVIIDYACGNRTMIAIDEKEKVYKMGMKFDYLPKLIDVPKDFEVGKPKKVYCGDQHYTILYGIVER